MKIFILDELCKCEDIKSQLDNGNELDMIIDYESDICNYHEYDFGIYDIVLCNLTLPYVNEIVYLLSQGNVVIS